jgi:NIPSNAP
MTWHRPGGSVAAEGMPWRRDIFGPASEQSDREALSTAVLELRQYTLHAGRRDTLIELFDRDFVEPQEAVGMAVVGQFRDLDRADRFVWLRGYRDMDARLAGLRAFYDGPTWLAHRNAANATMIDSDNVLLLAAASSRTEIALAPRPATTCGAEDKRVIVATIYYPRISTLQFSLAADAYHRGALDDVGAVPIGEYVSSSHPNNFPRLPVRDGEQAFVTLYRFADVFAYDRYLAVLATSNVEGRPAVAALDVLCRRPPDRLKLAPTSRSRL